MKKKEGERGKEEETREKKKGSDGGREQCEGKKKKNPVCNVTAAAR